MEPLRVIKSKAIPLDMVNIDTDQIIPKQFLKLVHRTGYGKYLFYDWRFDKDGKPKDDFVLNYPKYAGRQILLTRDNFGSGSSREHAAWAIHDYGLKAIIASSFADIFYNNCFKNGLLPIRIDQTEVEYLFSKVEEMEIEINLPKQKIITTNTTNPRTIHFEIEESKKKILLEGLDEIGITMHFDRFITEYESRRNGVKVSSSPSSQ
jgi:3-isopropylmalate/(R)-2-methylmalate dehydratase small subunit